MFRSRGFQLTVWFLGDSLFFPGPQRESSIPFQFGALLDRRTHPTIRVFSSPGLTSVDGVAVFKHRILSALSGGDIVILSLGMNDPIEGPRRSLAQARGLLARSADLASQFLYAQRKLERVEQLPQVSPKDSKAAFSYLLRRVRSRGAKAIALLPKNPLWIPRGQGRAKRWWWPGAEGAPAPVLNGEDESVLDDLFRAAYRLMNSGQYESALELISHLLEVPELSVNTRTALASMKASVFALQGDFRAAESLLNRVVEELGPDPVIEQQVAALRAEVGSFFEEHLLRALDGDEHLPRLTTRLRHTWAETASEFDFPVVDLSLELGGKDVLDHCHPTSKGSKRAAQALFRALFGSGDQPRRKETPEIQWEYPRIDYSRRRGDLRASYGIAGSQAAPLAVPANLREFLAQHPGLVRATDIPTKLPAHQVFRFPQLAWTSLFSESVEASWGNAGWFRSLCPPPDTRLFPEWGRRDRISASVRASDVPLLATRLMGYTEVSSVFYCSVRERLQTLRRWYPVETVLFGGGSGWTSLIDRQDLLVFLQCAAQLQTAMKVAGEGALPSFDTDLAAAVDDLVRAHQSNLGRFDLSLPPQRSGLALDGYKSSLGLHRRRIRTICLEIREASLLADVEAPGFDYHPQLLGTLQVQHVASSCRTTKHESALGISRTRQSGAVSDTMYPLY